MGTLNAFYVRGTGDATISGIRKIFPDATIESGQDFLGVVLANDAFEPPKDELVGLSSDLGTDVIWLSFQSVVDAFMFHRWRGGSLLRSLVFGCYGDEERMWNQVDGQPEPWEREAFFDSRTLEFLLQKIARGDEEKREFERIWREMELVPDRAEPSIEARESARKVAEYYHFPGWG
jgi:hypothetical protein